MGVARVREAGGADARGLRSSEIRAAVPAYGSRIHAWWTFGRSPAGDQTPSKSSLNSRKKPLQSTRPV